MYNYRRIKRRKRSERAEHHHEATRPDFKVLSSTWGRSRCMASVLTLFTMSLISLLTTVAPRDPAQRNTIPSKLQDRSGHCPTTHPTSGFPPGINARFHAISPLGTNDCRRHRCEPRHYGCRTAHIHGPGNQPEPAIPRRLVITARRKLPTRW